MSACPGFCKEMVVFAGPTCGGCDAVGILCRLCTGDSDLPRSIGELVTCVKRGH